MDKKRPLTASEAEEEQIKQFRPDDMINGVSSDSPIRPSITLNDDMNDLEDDAMNDLEDDVMNDLEDDVVHHDDVIKENIPPPFSSNGLRDSSSSGDEPNRKISSVSFQDPHETSHISEENQPLEKAMPEQQEDEPAIETGDSSETIRFIQKYFGQLLELPQLLLNKSLIDIQALIAFTESLEEEFTEPLLSELNNIFPVETFKALQNFLQTLGSDLQGVIYDLLEADKDKEEEFVALVNDRLQTYCSRLNKFSANWDTMTLEEQYSQILESEYVLHLTSGPVLFADFYGRVFEDVIVNIKDQRQKQRLQEMLEEYIKNSNRRKSIKADLAASWQMIVQFLLLFKGASGSLKKICPDVVSTESLKHVTNTCSYFEIFTDLANLISAISVGFKTSESMIDHIRGWSPEQLTAIRKQPRGFIQSIHPKELEFYPIPKKDKIRDSKATLYLFSDKLVIKISKDGFSSQFLRGLGYHLPDITIYDLDKLNNISISHQSVFAPLAPSTEMLNQKTPGTPKMSVSSQYKNSVVANPKMSVIGGGGGGGGADTPTILTMDVENARSIEVVFKAGPDVSEQDKQSGQFISFLQKLVNINKFHLYTKCTSIVASSRLELLNELARCYSRLKDLDKPLPEAILCQNPGLLGEISVEKFSIQKTNTKRLKTEVIAKKGTDCKAVRLLILTNGVYISRVGPLKEGVNEYPILRESIDNFQIVNTGGSAVNLVIESKSLQKNFLIVPEVIKGAAGTASKLLDSIRHYINCYKEIQLLNSRERPVLQELHVHARDPELKPNRK